MYGWIIAKNIDLSFLNEQNAKRYSVKEYNIFVNVMNKFRNDTLFVFDEDKIRLLDGVILNKKELLEARNESDWKSVFEQLIVQKDFPNVLRGCFNGVLYDEIDNQIVVYTNHVGDRPIYYYFEEDKMLISSNYNYMLEVLKHHCIDISGNLMAVECMLTYGYMLEDVTFCNEIHRLLPGSKLVIKTDEKNSHEIRRYYEIDNTEDQNMTEEEAIERIDRYFRKSIQREFEKDIEYGYKHLVDLSGGLDSRMVCWVADEMGYKDQVNVSYCKAGYYDEKISKEIAQYLNHEYIFKFLDDKKFLYDIELLMNKNFCAATYFGITGGNRMLQSLNMQLFGLEHTGQLGDVLLSTFYEVESENFAPPVFGEKAYSNYMQYEFDHEILKRYKNKEVFALNARGFLGACSTHIIRQNYTEVASPFLDVDFMNACLSIPFHIRKNHNIYLKWIEKKYPKALEFQWEKTRVKMTKGWEWRSKFKMLGVRGKHAVEKYLLKKQYTDTMNPFEYWYKEDSQIKAYLDSYYHENKHYLEVFDRNKVKEIEGMFENSNVVDKMLVLSAIAGVKKVYDK